MNVKYFAVRLLITAFISLSLYAVGAKVVEIVLASKLVHDGLVMSYIAVSIVMFWALFTLWREKG